nr:iron ABC transporter permease [Clostridia bacterium]
RNPMADPGIIGVSTGAALAAVSILLVFPGLSRWVPIAAFLGGCAACVLVFILSWKNGADPVRLILSGVAVNALLGGGVSLLSLLYSDRVLLWINGSLSGKSLADVSRLLPFNAVGVLLAVGCVPYANALILGDDTAKSLGIPVHAARICLSAVSAYLTGISIASVGLIGFLGLIIPHVARMLGGSNYKILIPLSALLGASLLVGADCAARTAFSPTEIPVGIVMSVLGGPFFIGLLRRKGRV